MPTFYLSFFLLLLPCINAVAQTDTTSPQRALNIIFEKGNLMAALSGHEWRSGLSLAAAHLAVGQTISLNVTLTKDVDYVFLASGADEQADVDLYLRDSSGRILAEDQEEDGTPIIEYSVPSSGTFQLQLHLAAGQFQETYVALSLLRRGGSQVTEQDYQSVSSGFFAAAKKITTSKEAQWQQQAGEWCLFGYSLHESNGVSLRQLHPGSARVFFAAAGPDWSAITLSLANDSRQIVAETKRSEAFPLLSYDPLSGTLFDLRIGLERSKLPALILLGIFTEPSGG